MHAAGRMQLHLCSLVWYKLEMSLYPCLQGPKDSQDTDTQITELSDAAQNPMLGKALNIEE